ncbi:hypothetical protein GQ55_8G236000 [Panicum hallii var. hallii]|uniref:Uncharacterized protein n=1 Tax=Panicum hallii var. hallii TaxID=1504633 RepID=A0A2T7CQI5_9POAL|nr:hypothetical protein GQ55_8G236000 [Panicum hallii var. hallii]
MYLRKLQREIRDSRLQTPDRTRTMFFSVRARQAMHVDDPTSPKHIRPHVHVLALNQTQPHQILEQLRSLLGFSISRPAMPSSPDPVAALGAAPARPSSSPPSAAGRPPARTCSASATTPPSPRGLLPLQVRRVGAVPGGRPPVGGSSPTTPTATGTRPAAAPPSCSGCWTTASWAGRPTPRQRTLWPSSTARGARCTAPTWSR